MENPEEILHSLEEFAKFRPKDIPRELEEYLCFVAKTGDPVYQWSSVKSLFREKLISVISEFYESCPSVDIPPCPNVDLFNYDTMKGFILEKLETFSAAPFTIQRICELLTTPRKEYNRIDKYMRALEKNILVVSTTEPGRRNNAENGEGIVNGIETDHLPESSSSNSSTDINVEEMDDAPSWPHVVQNDSNTTVPSVDSARKFSRMSECIQGYQNVIQETFITESKLPEEELGCSSSQDNLLSGSNAAEDTFVSINTVASNACTYQENVGELPVNIDALPDNLQNTESNSEPVVSSEVPSASDSSTGQERLSEAEGTISPIPDAEEEKSVDSTTLPQLESDVHQAETTNSPFETDSVPDDEPISNSESAGCKVRESSPDGSAEISESGCKDETSPAIDKSDEGNLNIGEAADSSKEKEAESSTDEPVEESITSTADKSEVSNSEDIKVFEGISSEVEAEPEEFAAVSEGILEATQSEATSEASVQSSQEVELNQLPKSNQDVSMEMNMIEESVDEKPESTS